jgi:hypothetical protein
VGSNVYANGREVSAKSDDNRSVCAMPDICLSPPSPPAGPVPIPYPNTAKASDTSDGSKSVKIGGDEVGLKNKSSYKSSNGDEAATKTLGMGVVTHTIQGKMKHAAWSFDVKIEGENVIRHLDITTHNHINQPNIALVVNQASQNIEQIRALTCKELAQMNKNVVQGGEMSSTSGSFTSTTASYTQGGQSSYMQAVTPADLIKSQFTNGFACARPPNQTMACTDEQWGAGGNNNHTEPKLIEQIFDAARQLGVGMPTAPGGVGTLKMQINHKSGSGTDNEPCERCQKGICAAVKCGLEILLCEGDPPKEANAKDKCESGTYQTL